MSPEWLTAIGTLGTFVVIAASAVAALMQLRHMRSSNQILALNELRETIESADFQEAQRFVNHDLPKLFEDPENRRKLVTPGPIPNEFEPMRMVANFFESFGAMVKRKIIDADIACDLWGFVIERTWERISPWIISRREASNLPSLYENFEYLTVMTELWNEKYPAGIYPPNLRRMPGGEAWPEAKARHDVP